MLMSSRISLLMISKTFSSGDLSLFIELNESAIFEKSFRRNVSSVFTYPSFDVQRRHLLAGVSVLLRQFVEINSLPNDVLVQILLYGDKNLPNEIKKIIFEMTLVFIHNAGRFD